MRRNAQLTGLTHHVVGARGDRTPAWPASAGAICPVCQQPVVPTYRVIDQEILHPWCATDVTVRHLSDKLDALTKRLNLLAGDHTV